MYVLEKRKEYRSIYPCRYPRQLLKLGEVEWKLIKNLLSLFKLHRLQQCYDTFKLFKSILRSKLKP